MVKDNAAMRSELRKLQAKERRHFASTAENARDHVKLRDEAAAGRCAVNWLHGKLGTLQRLLQHLWVQPSPLER
eukprot:4717994-Pleurochrysis_carterae.AAC.1